MAGRGLWREHGPVSPPAWTFSLQNWERVNACVQAPAWPHTCMETRAGGLPKPAWLPGPAPWPALPLPPPTPQPPPPPPPQVKWGRGQQGAGAALNSSLSRRLPHPNYEDGVGCAHALTPSAPSPTFRRRAAQLRRRAAGCPAGVTGALALGAARQGRPWVPRPWEEEL